MFIDDRENARVSEGFSTSLSAYKANGTDLAFGKNLHKKSRTRLFT